MEPIIFRSDERSYEALYQSNVSVVYTTVTGFVEKKAKYWFSDYLFVLEVYWTSKRTTFIKRSYTDVIELQEKLISCFSEKYQKGIIKNPVHIPRLKGKALFQPSSIELAENRELELQNFFRELIGGNPLISNNKILTNFFSHWPCDPPPCDSQDLDISVDNEESEDDVLFDR